MRIIAGERRGFRLEGPRGSEIRPTSDLVRESIFNILGATVVEANVVDLFAGTGAIGLEALSRGASRVVFIERDRDHAALIRRNLAALRFEHRAHVAVGDAYRWARGFTPTDANPMLVFADPPYRDFQTRAKPLRALFEGLIEKLPRGSILTVESSWSREEDRVLPDLDLWDIRKHGSTRIAVRVLEDAAAEKSGGDTEGDPEAESSAGQDQPSEPAEARRADGNEARDADT